MKCFTWFRKSRINPNKISDTDTDNEIDMHQTKRIYVHYIRNLQPLTPCMLETIQNMDDAGKMLVIKELNHVVQRLQQR